MRWGNVHLPMMNSRKKIWTAVYLLVGASILTNFDLGYINLELRRNVPYFRRLAIECVHSIYVPQDKPEDALNLPSPPGRSDREVPSYIAMCHEFIRREAEEDDAPDPVRIAENAKVCTDWTSPHYAMLEMIASFLIGGMLPGLKYRHDCDASRQFDEATFGFDRTTLQQTMLNPGMAPDFNIFTLDDLKQQCKVCLANYDPVVEDKRVSSRATHHCLVWPEQPTPAGVIPLKSLARPLKARFLHNAVAWSNVTDHPPLEEESGVVIVIDPGTMGIPYSEYVNYIPATAGSEPTSIMVLTSPLCVAAFLPSGQLCIDYANGLTDYLNSMYGATLADTGYNNGPGVQMQMVSSTAGSFSRMVLVKTLICPPNTNTCILPALGKKEYTKCILLEPPVPGPGPGPGVCSLFEDIYKSEVDCITITETAAVPLVEVANWEIDTITSTMTTKLGDPIPDCFVKQNVGLTYEGYPLSEPTPTTITHFQAYTLTDDDIMTICDVSIEGNIADLPNTNPGSVETVPTLQQVIAAVLNKEPLDANYHQPAEEATGGDPSNVSSEMATDSSVTDLFTEQVTADNFIMMYMERRESVQRIADERHDYSEVLTLESNVEIDCPQMTDDGSPIQMTNGAVISEQGNNVVFSSGIGTVIFEKPVDCEDVPMTFADVLNPTTGLMENLPVTQISDPITGSPIEIVGDFMTIDAKGTYVKSPIGAIVWNPLNGNGTLILEGFTGILTADPNTVLSCSGKIVDTGTAAADEAAYQGNTGAILVRQGDGYAIQDPDTFSGFGADERGTENDKADLTVKQNGTAVKEEDSTGHDVMKTDVIQHDAPALADAVTQIPTSDCLWLRRKKGKKYTAAVVPELPIDITAQYTNSVNFDVHQTFKATDSISWVAVDGIQETSGEFNGGCIKTNEVKFGPYASYSAACVDGKATIDVYIHDGQISDLPDITSSIPGTCNPSKDLGSKCHFTYELSCVLAPTRRLQEAVVDSHVAVINGDEFKFGMDIDRVCHEQENHKKLQRFIASQKELKKAMMKGKTGTFASLLRGSQS